MFIYTYTHKYIYICTNIQTFIYKLAFRKHNGLT